MVGVDTNMCCGTHVSNLSHLQAVKLLHTESKQGSTLLYFVSGSRVCNLLEKCYQSERALTKMLRCVSLFPSEPGDCRKCVCACVWMCACGCAGCMVGANSVWFLQCSTPVPCCKT